MTPRHRLSPRRYTKAIAATVTATVAAAIGNAMADGNLTAPETVAAIGLGLTAGAAVYLSPKNRETVDGGSKDHPVDWS